MRSLLVFWFIVGVALGSNTFAWKENKEYTYNIHGRTLAGHEIGNEYSGIFLKASLKIQTRPDGKLQCMIVNARFAQIHSELADSWMVHIPDRELSWKPLELTKKPFQIILNRGVITDLVVSNTLRNWEANIIKAIVSQFQMNLNDAQSNLSRKGNRQDSAIYRVYEETVSGNTDTGYEINPVPEDFIINSDTPDFQILEGDEDQILEVVKHKDYTNNTDFPAYIFGLGELPGKGSGLNRLGTFFMRHTMTRALVTGNLKQFTIQQTQTLNEVVMNPTLSDKQRVAVYTSWNTTLKQVTTPEHIIEDIVQPLHLDSLVYAYGKPDSQNHKVEENISNNRSPIDYIKKIPQKLHENIQKLHENIQKIHENIFSKIKKQPQPQLNKGSENPFFAYSIGNNGGSVKSNVDVVKTAIKLAQKIGEIIQDPVKTLEENVLGMFITLTHLIQTMDELEIRKISQELYTTKEDSSKYASWAAFRDAVAGSGHGSALLMIQSWIELKNIKNEEASHVISTMIKAVQHPTTHYIKTLFELIKKPVVVTQWPLNETIILGFSDLVHKVYFNTDYFESQFPSNSFEKLRDEVGLSFVKDTVIPYWTQLLNKAITEGETENIHTFTRALGLIGQPEILKAYEPYLEGTKQSSQFQRVLMILSMDRLAKNFPTQVGSVLFMAYTNLGETTAVRMSALLQLFRTSPTVGMIEHVAAYTKIDPDKQVNAVAKSLILSLAELSGSENSELREAAILAKSLLTNEDYGIHQGGVWLNDFIFHELDVSYAQQVELGGSDYMLMPNSIRYALKSDIRGMKKPVIDVQAIVTSVGELVNVLKEQTQSYNEEKQQQKQNADTQGEYPWSSLNIAKILNMKTEDREQLEGVVLSAVLDTPYKMFSFNNRTIERLPKVIELWEDKLKNGQKIDYVKFLNSENIAIGIPNEMGLPLIATINIPWFVRAKGSIKAISEPKLSINDKIQTPNNIQAELDLDFTLASKVNGRVTVITPFDGQEYVAAYNKVLQVHVPINSKIKLDVTNKELQINLGPKQVEVKTPLLHYSTWPYTARKDVLDFQHSKHHQQVIKPVGLRKVDRVVGRREMGVAIHIEMEHDRNTINMHDMRSFCKHGLINGFRHIWNDANIQYSHLNISYVPEQSSSHKVTIRLGYAEEYKQQGDEKPLNWQELRQANTPQSRQEIFKKGVSSGIKNVQSHVVDALVHFQGDNSIKYIVSGAHASSNVDSRSRVYALYKKLRQGDKPVEIEFASVNNVPNVISMDLQDILKAEPTAQSAMEMRMKSENGESRVKAAVKLVRSAERKDYLTEQPKFQECSRDSRQFNKQSPACRNMTIEGNLLNKIIVDVKHENIEPSVQDFIDMVYSHLRYIYYPSLDIKNEKTSIPRNQVKMEAHLDRDLKYVNVSVELHDQLAIFRDVELNEYVKRMLAVHPSVDVSTRVMSKALEIDTMKEACVVDSAKVTTFENWTYPANLSKSWTVAAQYIPRRGKNVQEQLREQPKNYIIMVRQNPQINNGKDLKVVLSSPETDFKIIDITMTPDAQSVKTKALVSINNQQVQIKETESRDIGEGFVQIYGLPNGEVVLMVRNNFAVVYDGRRSKILTYYGFIRHSTRGLCGQYNGQQTEDLLTPQNCIAVNTDKFIKSFEVEGQIGKEVRQELEKKSDECIKRNIPLYVDLIKEKNVNHVVSDNAHGNDCTQYQRKYVENERQICFSLNNIRRCKNHCQAQGFITKSESVYCIPNNSFAQIWKKQIDTGVNPDLSGQPVTKVLQMEVPQSCSNE